MMKNVLAAAAAAFIGLAAFAEDSGAKRWSDNLCFGVGIPCSIEVIFASESGEHDIDTSNVGCTFHFQDVRVRDDKFTVMCALDIGGTDMSQLDGGRHPPAVEGETGFLVGFDFGLGGSPLYTEKFLLSIMGTIGYEFRWFGKQGKAEGVETELDWMLHACAIGANVFFSFKPTKRVGFFLDTKFKLFKFGVLAHTTEVKFGGASSTSSGSNGFFGPAVTPSLGVCLRL